MTTKNLKEEGITSHPVHAVYDGLFNAASGTIIDLNKPTPEMFNIKDIASALSKICRFGGHSMEFYSVAQHSVIVSRLAPAHCKLEALLHDAAEAYLGDVIKPLKVILGKSYREVEQVFEECIRLKFGLNLLALMDVKPFDAYALELEFAALVQGDYEGWTNSMQPLAMPDLFMNPVDAEDAFLMEYMSLTKTESE